MKHTLEPEQWRYTLSPLPIPIETLVLDFLAIKALPREIGQCTALKSVELTNLFGLSALPIILAQLDKIERLVIKNMRFTSFPDVIDHLKALKSLELTNSFSFEEVLEKLHQITTITLNASLGADPGASLF